MIEQIFGLEMIYNRLSFFIIRYRYVIRRTTNSLFGTSNSLFAVMDGHGPHGDIIAEIVRQFLISKKFLKGLNDVAKSAGKDEVNAYEGFFDKELLKLERLLVNHKIPGLGEYSGTSLALLLLNKYNCAVVVLIGDSSFIGFEKGTLNLGPSFKQHTPANVS